MIRSGSVVVAAILLERKMKPYLPLLVLLTAIFTTPLGCSESSVSTPSGKKTPAEDPSAKGSAASEPSSSDPVVEVDESNVEMEVAIAAARETFDQFAENWDSIENDGVSVKFGLPTRDGGIEHIWFKPMTITKHVVLASCENDPANVEGLKYGDRRTFKRSEITDWMILVGDKCYGGYMMRALAKIQPENDPPYKFIDF